MKTKEEITKYKTDWAKSYRENNRERFNKKASEYYHRNKEEVNKRRRNNPYSLMSILKRNALKRNMEFSLTKEDFTEWWNNQKQECVYCEIPIERMSIVDKSKKMAKRLTIDRMDNSKGYMIGNIALCCMQCNFIKSNLFSFKEMSEIGQKYIKPKWQL